MEERRSSGVVHFYCPYCLKGLEETGDLVPRKLPCSHTVCERCLRRLAAIRARAVARDGAGDGVLTCPECKRRHTVVRNDVMTFPQDKKIMMGLRQKNTSPEGGPVERLGRCREHGKELILFCNSGECNRPVCQRCLPVSHRGHDVVDIDEKEEDLLLKIDFLTGNLLKGKKGMQAEQHEILRNNNECLIKLQAKKEEHLKAVSKKYDVLMQTVVDQNTKTNTRTGQCIQYIDEHIGLLNHIKSNVKRDGSLTEELVSGVDTVVAIADNVTVDLTGRCFEYNKSPNTDGVVDSVWGFLTHMDRQVVLNGTKSLVREDTRQNASEFKSRVISVICTEYREVHSLYLVGVRSVVVLGARSRRRAELAEYRFKTGARTQQVAVHPDCTSLAGTSVAAKACVAVSYENQKLIEFRALTEFNRVVHEFHMTRDNPHTLWSSTPTTLLNGHQICILLNPFRVMQLNFGSFIQPSTKSSSETSAAKVEAKERQAKSTGCLQSPKKPSAAGSKKIEKKSSFNASSSSNASFSSNTLLQQQSSSSDPNLLNQNSPPNLQSGYMFSSTGALPETRQGVTRSTSFQEPRQLPSSPSTYSLPPTPQLRASSSVNVLSPMKLMAEGYIMAAWDSAQDLCCVRYGEQIVLIISGFGRVNAYDPGTMHLYWKVEGYLPGVKKKFSPSCITTNERGHLFVCDRENACVHVFRIANGKYMGMILRRGDMGIGTPGIIRWCEERSALVVAHQRETTWDISVVKLE